MDGPIHDYADVAARDGEATERLEDAGYTVVRFPADEKAWPTVLAQWPSVFGISVVSYAVGSLVRARGREWVVLPDSDEQILVLRPLGGTDDEVAGILPTLEQVEQATFSLPDPDQVGDYRSARLLRDALRLGFRSSAGPFRSFGHIAVEPRPYQLVPLLMALKLDPVRLLIADDVGVGKTVEALLIARELLEQGDAQRLAVLCPPHLAEQWQGEMRDKFHLDAELVLTSTARKLERGLGIGESLFERHPLTVVSTDFIKADRRRLEFLRAAPELVIVDEAHTCADPMGGRGRHQRYQLVSGLAEDPARHLILATATPHSGKEEPFRALVGFLDPSFAELPEDLTTEQRRTERERLARHFVQRRRADIRSYLDAETVFPEREALETSYTLSAGLQALLRASPRLCPRERCRPEWRTAPPTRPVVVCAGAAACARLEPSCGRRDVAHARPKRRHRHAGGGRRSRSARSARPG